MLFKALARFICELTFDENYDAVEKALTSHSATSQQIEHLFSLKFDPQKKDLAAYQVLRGELLQHKDTLIQHALLFIDALL